jgi:nicotinate-nucleotide--dimethylbenzimidazole phosphoribosyltransferase
MTAAQTAAAAPQAPAIALEDIRRLAQQDLPALTLPAAPDSLGDFAPHWQWMTAAQGKSKAAIRHPRLAVFLSTHGAFAEEQTNIATLPALLGDSKHPLSALAVQQNADLQIYELDLQTTSADFRTSPALAADNAVQAIAYGMMAVQPGVDFLILATANPVTEKLAAEIRTALDKGDDVLQTLLQYGGFDLCACVGAALAARLARVPVLLDDTADITHNILAALKADAVTHVRKAGDILPQQMPKNCGIRAGLALGLLQSLTQSV